MQVYLDHQERLLRVFGILLEEACDELEVRLGRVEAVELSYTIHTELKHRVSIMSVLDRTNKCEEKKEL